MCPRAVSARTIALATSADYAALHPDDVPLRDALAARGVRAVAAVWSDPAVDWRATDAALVRTCWDYHYRLGEFHGWLDALEARGVAVWNPVPVLRWNLDKRYLRDLAARGVPIVPTWWVEAGAEVALARGLEERGWTDAIVKPAVSASAHETYRASALQLAEDRALARRLEVLTAQGAVLVQPFLPEVLEGEWSLLFFDGVYSHAVLKRPRPGDFRVQTEHGGSASPEEPGPALIMGALEVVRAAVGHLATSGALGAAEDAMPLYARVDGAVLDGVFTLMELEILEPQLFLRTAHGAAERFAEAIVRRLGDLPTR